MIASKRKNRLITSTAVANGFLLELGISPLGAVVSEVVVLSPLLTAEFSSMMRALLFFGTALDLLVGLGNMWEWGGTIGAVAFFVGIAGGAVLLYHPMVGVAMIGTALFLAEHTPVSW